VLLVDVTRCVGVAVALLGSLVVAPGGVRHLVSTWTGWSGRQRRRVRRQAARFLPFLREHATVSARAVAASAGIAVSAEVAGSITVWKPNAPVDERIELLRGRILELEGMIRGAEFAIRQESNDRRSQVAALENAFAEEVNKLRQLIDEHHEQAAAIDGRGLPLIGMGILLSGIPDILARAPYGFGWSFPALGVLSALTVVHGWLRSKRRAPAGPL